MSHEGMRFGGGYGIIIPGRSQAYILRQNRWYL